MAKKNCSICGAEIGLMKQVQLADREFICRDCVKKTSPFFVPLERTTCGNEAGRSGELRKGPGRPSGRPSGDHGPPCGRRRPLRP